MLVNDTFPNLLNHADILGCILKIILASKYAHVYTIVEEEAINGRRLHVMLI